MWKLIILKTNGKNKQQIVCVPQLPSRYAVAVKWTMNHSS